MARRQGFVVGQNNSNTNKALSNDQLNTAWNPLEVLKAGMLDGVFFALSTITMSSSEEICNLLQGFGITPDPSDSTQVLQLIQRLQETSLRFMGYVSTTEPSSSTFTLSAGDLWINTDSMPTSFPVPAAQIRRWDGSSWVAATADYSATNFDAWRDVDDNEGYYWFGGQWVILSTDLSTVDFILGPDGKYLIKDGVLLRGYPTVQYAPITDMGIVNKKYVDDINLTITQALALKATINSPTFTGIPKAPTAAAGTSTTQLATTEFVQTAIATGTTGIAAPTGTILPYGGTNLPAGYLWAQGAEISRTTYAALFAVYGTTYGAGDGNTTFNLPDYTNARLLNDNIYYTTIQNESYVPPSVLTQVHFHKGDGYMINASPTGQNISSAGDRIYLNAGGSAGGGAGPNLYLANYIDFDTKILRPSFIIKY